MKGIFNTKVFKVVAIGTGVTSVIALAGVTSIALKDLYKTRQQLAKTKAKLALSELNCTVKGVVIEGLKEENKKLKENSKKKGA